MEKDCVKIENFLSIPIWFNRTLKTKFDTEISKAGFNFIKDIFPENQQLAQFNGLRNMKIRKLKNIRDKIPPIWQNKIVNSCSNFITVIPDQIINLQDNDYNFKDITSKQIYQQLIGKKIRPPSGLLYWFEEFDI